MENSIGYLDYEISQVQEQLKSIKNVGRLQAMGSSCIIKKLRKNWRIQM